MGKVEDLRALRQQIRDIEQRAVIKAGAGGGKGMQGVRPKGVVVDEAQNFGLPVEELCGHQAIGGKRCIRPKDHTEKNHRYAKTAKPA